MTFDPTKIPSHLLEATRRRALVPFIGAGISRLAETERPLPSWPELIHEILKLALTIGDIDVKCVSTIEELTRRHEYSTAAQLLKDQIHDNMFEHFIAKRFLAGGVKPGLIHKLLFKLGAPVIVTTNYDRLLEAAYVETFSTIPTIATPDHLYRVSLALKEPWTQSTPVIFKLHGTVDQPSSIVLGESDYVQLYRHDHYKSLLRTILISRTILILGTSFSDPEIARIFAEVRNEGNYIVLPKGARQDFEFRRLRKIFGIEVIEYEPSDDHRELVEFVQYLVKTASGNKRSGPKRRK